MNVENKEFTQTRSVLIEKSPFLVEIVDNIIGANACWYNIGEVFEVRKFINQKDYDEYGPSSTRDDSYSFTQLYGLIDHPYIRNGFAILKSHCKKIQQDGI